MRLTNDYKNEKFKTKTVEVITMKNKTKKQL